MGHFGMVMLCGGMTCLRNTNRQNKYREYNDDISSKCDD